TFVDRTICIFGAMPKRAPIVAITAAVTTGAGPRSFDTPPRQRKDLRMRKWIFSLSLCTASWLVLPGMSPVSGSDARETPHVRAVRRAQSAIVNIHSERTARERDAFDGNPGRKVNGMGTGVIVDERGYIVTNQHVIAGV